MKRGWTISADTGGTFTDVIGTDPGGGRHRLKVLSSSALRGTLLGRIEAATFEIEAGWLELPAPLGGLAFRRLGIAADACRVVSLDRARARITLDADFPLDGEAAFELVSPEPAPVFGARLMTGTAPGRPLPVEELRLATTRGTNALLQRRGAPTALFITGGFADLLEIGDQRRPDLFARRIVKPEPLQRAIVEVAERLAADGSIVTPLDPVSLDGPARRLLDAGIDIAAVALLHAYRNPVHEQTVGRRLRELGFLHVVLSSEAAPRIKIVPRATTAVVDAFLAPALSDYLRQVSASLAEGRLRVMTSAGGLASPAGFTPKDGLLSGPAGGVVGAAAVARNAGLKAVIAFDMGGTSTDVSRVTGDFDYRFEHEVGGVTVAAPALAIETVAAGGGSICGFDGQHLTVGPASAGADPGPACYGNGGPLTLTDVNLLSGQVVVERFGVPLAIEDARRAFEDLCGHCGAEDPDAVLDGLRAIADERMAGAVRQVSLRRGYDPADHALVAFGGAGGQHACAVADQLGIDRVLVPADAGVLSAVGLSGAVLERFAERQLLLPMDEALTVLPDLLARLETDARRRLDDEGVPAESIVVRRRMAFLRFAGQDSTLEVPIDDPAQLPARFVDRYGELFGHDPGDRPVEVDAVRIVVSSRVEPESRPVDAAIPAAARGRRQRSRFAGAWSEATVHDRETLSPGGTIAGPALVVDAHSTAVIEPGWEARVEDDGALRLQRIVPAVATRPSSVERELFTHRFEQIAREMGERLRHTAVSTNVKERLDFSCALLDPDGRLVVNAPHIPVHLGALGLCVRTVCRSVDLEPGDVVVTNHPAYGGSHLPDVTVITPVHADDGTSLGYAANRAHHAEIGGSRPGSMPPDATRLSDEGVVIPPTHLLRRGHPCWEEVTSLLTSPPWPTRNLADNRADLEAAVAANHAGAEALRELASNHGAATVIARMGEVTELAGERLGRALASFDDGVYRAQERLDDGTPLAVSIDVAAGRARVDFSGSGPVHRGNLNATPAIVGSAVLYVMRLLLDRPFPLNEGLMEPVSIVLPPSLLAPDFSDDPRACPAVVGGNVETSQRLVDTLIKALRLAACSQGTMNNVLFGDERISYYETVCGGSGAGADFDGTSAVHTHMTNTAITDPELLEHRYPVRIERFGIRRGSGGTGRHCGGDGVVRELTFLEDLELSVLSQHRVAAPYGMEGGEPGERGSQRLVRADGTVESLTSVDARDVRPGDRLILETPGGGGWGA